MSGLWYREAASIWEEALPLGNGKLGAMIFGGAKQEHLQVNEETMWYGGEVNRINPNAYSVLEEVRNLVRNGDPSKAQEVMGMAMAGCPNSMHPYQTLGDLYIDFEVKGDVTDYKRELCLDTAVQKTTMTIDGVNYTREYFISKPAECMVMRFKASKEKSLSFALHMGRAKFFDGIKQIGTKGICLYGNLGVGGSQFEMMVKAASLDGEVKAVGETLIVSKATEAMLYFSADTSYGKEFAKEDSEKIFTLLEQKTETVLEKAMITNYEKLLSEHVEDYQGLYGRVTLVLDDAEDEQEPTNLRLQMVAEGKEDLGLQKLLFDYGRYLLIACSREGGLPANLQGIWNKDFEPAWDAKYTININAQMNYWPAEICNLSDCHEPLFTLLEKVRKTGKKTAWEMYHCRGFCAHHNTDIHGDSAPQDIWYPATFWPLGGAWLCTHLWTHYEYTKDVAFLQKALPTMLEAALFFVDYLTPYGQYLVTNPSVSPENTYILPNGNSGCCCLGPTMDNQILRDLFHQCIAGYEMLKKMGPVELEVDGIQDTEALLEEIQEALARLIPTQIGSDGRIMEWLEEYEEEEPGHRHISHLYGLYPSDQINVDGTPELAKAARRTLEYRLSHGGGHTGWSRAWIMNHYAKLWDGEECYNQICQMLTHSIYPNMFDKHPPFQIDGNFGACAAIAHMLLQSNSERVVVLPALPSKWKKGMVKGLKAVGNATYDIAWENGKITGMQITAGADYSTKVRFGDRVFEGGKQENTVDLKAGEVYCFGEMG